MSEATAIQRRGGGALKRGLHARHVTMIAIGGAIGTGLFLASGQTIATAGPGGALVAYGLMGIMVFFLMQSLGEMAAYIPASGSFQEYGRRFVSHSFGFAMGWNYWYNFAVTVASELAAAALVMTYWLPNTPGWVWSLLFLVLLVGLNVLSVKGYGESEFWFALIKVATIIIFLVVGILMIVGIMGHAPGGQHWGEGEAPFVSGVPGILAVFMVAGFSFQGTEILGVTAAETKEPEKNIPRATRTIFWRILLFYIGAIAVIGTLISYRDPKLLRSDVTDVAVSPFTLVFDHAGVALAAGVMNAVILTSVLSAGNSGLYVSSRMLQALAEKGDAPAFLARINRRGIPVAALIATVLMALVCLGLSHLGSGQAYYWLVSASGLAGFITWIGIAWCHFKFRRAFLAQGHTLDELPFRAMFYPAGPLIALAMCIFVVIGQGYFIVTGGGGAMDLVASYIGLPLFLILWIVHKIVTKSPVIGPTDADLTRVHGTAPVDLLPD